MKTHVSKLRTWPLAMLLGTLSLAVLISAPVVQASTSYLPTWAGVYPSSFSDDNARCRLCHAASTQHLNPYGEALCSSNAGNISNRILAVEAVDSDADPTGSSNITESNASTQPGWTPGGVNPTYSSSNCSPTGLVEAPSVFISGNMDPAIINQFPWELFMPAILNAVEQKPLEPSEARVVTLNTTLTKPWGLAFLPDGRILITQKAGSMLILSADGATAEATVTGLPSVLNEGQGGLLDVALDPDFATDPWVYWTYAEAGTGEEVDLAGTAVARGRLIGSTLQDVSVIYRQAPKVSGTGHYGSRLAFGNDKTLFVTLGERQKGSPAQDLATTLGKVIRINRDGTVPSDNPAISGALSEIWSYGHRNPQGAAVRPNSNTLWIHEHGPQGGDEINLVEAGGNYGWPLVSYGCNYGDPVGEACQIGGGTHAPTYIEPISYWVPISIAPAGMIFYTGTVFPQWRGDIFMGALAGTALWRVKLKDNSEVEREQLFPELGERIRDVEQGPKGFLYLLTDSGKLIQIRN